MNIIEKKVKDLKPYEKNPRLNDDAVKYVAESIKEFGFKQPIVIDKDNNIVCGHTRWKACKKLKIDTVPCVVADDLTEEQIRAYRLADNRVAEKAEWDLALLDTELAEIETIDMTLLGFDDTQEETPQEVVEDDFDEEPPEEPKSKLGDIYQLGENRLMCGDSTNKDDVARLMDGERVDIAFTSPPYNAGKSLSHNKNDTKYIHDDDNKSMDEYKDFLISFTELSLLYSDYSFINIQSLANNKIAIIDWLYDLKEKYADVVIWDKGHNAQPAIAKRVMNSRFEYIYCFSHEGTRAIGKKEFWGNVDNVFQLNGQRKNEFKDIHNATFPVELAGFFIETFSESSVLDLFGGTGTSLIACEQLNRKCFMMELEPRYVDVIINRWETFTGQKAVKLNAD